MYACLGFIIKFQEPLTIYLFCSRAYTLEHCIHQKEFIINSSYHTLFTKAISNHQCELLTVTTSVILSQNHHSSQGHIQARANEFQFSSTNTLLQASYAISWVLLNIENNFIHHSFL